MGPTETSGEPIQTRTVILPFDDLLPDELTLDITAVDCGRGIPRDDYRCPAAKAAARRFDSADVRVGSGWIDVAYAGERVTYLVAPTLRQQMLAFDGGGDFLPGGYTLARY